MQASVFIAIYTNQTHSKKSCNRMHNKLKQLVTAENKCNCSITNL